MTDGLLVIISVQLSYLIRMLACEHRDYISADKFCDEIAEQRSALLTRSTELSGERETVVWIDRRDA